MVTRTMLDQDTANSFNSIIDAIEQAQLINDAAPYIEAADMILCCTRDLMQGLLLDSVSDEVLCFDPIGGNA